MGVGTLRSGVGEGVCEAAGRAGWGCDGAKGGRKSESGGRLGGVGTYLRLKN